NADNGVIAQALKRGDRVQIRGFGTFETRQRKARTGRNPRTGQEIKIAGSNSPSFRAGQGLKDAIKEARRFATLPKSAAPREGDAALFRRHHVPSGPGPGSSRTLVARGRRGSRCGGRRTPPPPSRAVIVSVRFTRDTFAAGVTRPDDERSGVAVSRR